MAYAKTDDLRGRFYKMRDMRLRGDTYQEIANEFQVSRQLVSQTLHRYAMNEYDPKKRGPKPVSIEIDCEDVVRRLNSGESTFTVACSYGISYGQLLRLVKSAGYRLRWVKV